jgi:ribosomal subunit interface protein
MQIQVNTDNHIHGSTHLTEEVESILGSMLSRYQERITRVEVYLGDENSSQKTGESDKRCTMEARVAGMHPLAVSHHSNTVSQAIDGAADKLLKSLTRSLDRLSETKGRTSFAGDQTS